MEGQRLRNSFWPVMGMFYALYLNLLINNGCQEHHQVDSEASAWLSRKEPQLISNVYPKGYIGEWWYSERWSHLIQFNPFVLQVIKLRP